MAAVLWLRLLPQQRTWKLRGHSDANEPNRTYATRFEMPLSHTTNRREPIIADCPVVTSANPSAGQRIQQGCDKWRNRSFSSRGPPSVSGC